MASDSARREDHFQKKICPFKFCKIGLKNTLFTFGRKNGRLLFVVCCLLFVVCSLLFVVCCLLLLFVATLSDFGLLFFKLKLSSS